MTKQHNLPTATLMFRIARRFRGRYVANLLIWTTIWMLPIIPGIVTLRFFDSLEAGTAGANVGTLAAVFIAYGAGRLVIMTLGIWNDAHLGFRVESLLRRNMMERVYELPGAQSIETSPDESISRFREDVEHIEEAHGWTADVFGSVVFAMVAITILTRIDVRITIVVFAPLVLVSVVAEHFGDQVRRYRKSAREATGDVTGAIGELFTSVQSVKVAGAEETMIAHVDTPSDARRALMVKDRVLIATLESVFWNVLYVGTAFILVLSAESISSGSLSLGEFALFIYLLDFVTESVVFVGLFATKIKQAGVSFERMLGLMRGSHWEELVQDRNLAIGGDDSIPHVATERRTDPLETPEIYRLGYHYPGTTHGIWNVNLTIKKGDFAVITGKIGSGKTTLLRTLLGLANATEGEIRWNRELVIDRAAFFVPPQSAYTPQAPSLLSMSLRNNLLLGLDASEDDLAMASQIIVLDDGVVSATGTVDDLLRTSPLFNDLWYGAQGK